MSLATAQLHHIFGLKSGVTSNVWFFDEQNVVYTAGSCCVSYNIESKTQKFIQTTDKNEGITTLAVSPNLRYIALAEKADRPTITIYDLQTLRKKRILSTAEVQAGEYVSMAFSPDCKLLAAQGGRPDWTLLYWSWERSKVLAVTRGLNHNNLPTFQVNQISFSPTDSSLMGVVGNTIFRLMRCNEDSIRTYGVQKAEPLNYLCHAWMSEENILVGTDIGILFLFEATGEIKEEIRPPSEIMSESSKIPCIVALSNGFVCAAGNEVVYHYEKVEDTFRIKRKIMISADPGHVLDPTLSKQSSIECLALSPSEETLVASTNQSQLYISSLSGIDTNKEYHFDFLASSFHHAPVIDLDICIRKPLVATCSLDCTLKIWNYETCTLELNKSFNEEVLSVALHPSGLFLLAGFSEKLRMMNIFIDDIKIFKEFAVRGCRECAFSSGGHLFASVLGNMIQLYTTYSFKNIMNLKGHNGRVRAVVWSADDSKLVSCGMDGAIYEWETFSGKRIHESVLKTCEYSSIGVTPDGKTVFAVGSDQHLKEIAESRILREVFTGDVVLTCVTLSHSGTMIFAGTNKGSIYSVKYPLTIANDWLEYSGHDGPIVKLSIGYNDQTLVSVSEDACVILWKLHGRDAFDLQRETEVGWAEEILIVKKDLIEKNMEHAELNFKMGEFQNESKYQLHKKDVIYNEKMTALTETYISEIEKLKTKNELIKRERNSEEQEHQNMVEELVAYHTNHTEKLETRFNHKILQEFEKYQLQQSKMVEMQEDYEKQLADMENTKEKALEALTEYYEKKLAEQGVAFEQCHTEMRQQLLESAEATRQIEEDCDQEILDIKHTYEKKLREGIEVNAKLKEENSLLKKRFHTLHKEIDELKDEIKKLQAEAIKMKNVNYSLESDIDVMKNNVAERDSRIQIKETDIFALKRKNQELEKFKFVLNYKIKELREQIEPREVDIKKMKEQIHGMEMELGKFNKQNIQLELTVTELKQKLRATDKEMHRERQKVHDAEANLRRLKNELHFCIGHIQESRLFKERIKALYQKHVVEGFKAETASDDAEIQREFTRQKDHLERSIAVLRTKLEKDSGIHRADTVKIMQENVCLIKEISDLRKELKICRDLIHDLSAAINLENRHKKGGVETSMPFKDVNPMVAQEIEEQKKIIEMQQMELKRLRDEMYDMDRPSHHSKVKKNTLPSVRV